MNATPEPLHEKPPVERPWYDLHLSTTVIILLMVAFMVILEIPGEEVNTHDKDVGKTFWHGSPWVYLVRKVEPPVSRLDAWGFHGDTSAFKSSLFHLILDLIMAVMAIILVAFLFECRSRRHPRWFHFTLSELIFLTLIVGFMLSWWIMHDMQRNRGPNSNMSRNEGAVNIDGTYN